MEENKRNYTIRNLTEEEARKTLSEITKEELIEMLIISNRALDNALSFGNGHTVDFREMTPPPQRLDEIRTERTYYDCSDWKHCSNPFKDCINCPLRFGGGGGYAHTISTTGTQQL